MTGRKNTNYWRPPVAAARLKEAINTQLDILTIADQLGLKYEKHGRGKVRLVDHDSCIINVGKNDFARYSQLNENGKVVGGGPLDFYMHFAGKKYFEALHDLESQIEKGVAVVESAPRLEEETLTPEKRHRQLAGELSAALNRNADNASMRQVFAYLTKTRKIDPEIVQAFVNQKALFQISGQKGHAQCAFVGRNEKGLISAISFRGTSSSVRFMGDFEGCDYNRGWYFDPTYDLQQRAYDEKPRSPKKKILLCFESVIEVMSYMSILKAGGYKWKGFAYLATGSVTKTKAVFETVRLYKPKEVVMMYNNDLEEEKKSGRNPGKQAAELVAEKLLEQGTPAKVLLPQKANDWNDTLKAMKAGEIELSKKNEKSRMREPDRSR